MAKNQPFSSASSWEVIVNDLQIHLKDLQIEWSIRNERLLLLHSKLQETDPTPGLMTTLKPLVPVLNIQLGERRSILVQTLCNVIGSLARAVGDDFEIYAEQLLPGLFKLLIVTIKCISDSGHQAISDVIASTRMRSSLHLFRDGLSQSHQALRARCAEYLAMLLVREKTWDDIPREHWPVLEDSLRKALADANEKARNAARQAFARYVQLNRVRAEAFIAATVDLGLQKKLTTVLNGPTAAAPAESKRVPISALRKGAQAQAASTDAVVVAPAPAPAAVTPTPAPSVPVATPAVASTPSSAKPVPRAAAPVPPRTTVAPTPSRAAPASTVARAAPVAPTPNRAAVVPAITPARAAKPAPIAAPKTPVASAPIASVAAPIAAEDSMQLESPAPAAIVAIVQSVPSQADVAPVAGTFQPAAIALPAVVVEPAPVVTTVEAAVGVEKRELEIEPPVVIATPVEVAKAPLVPCDAVTDTVVAETPSTELIIAHVAQQSNLNIQFAHAQTGSLAPTIEYTGPHAASIEEARSQQAERSAVAPPQVADRITQAGAMHGDIVVVMLEAFAEVRTDIPSHTASEFVSAFVAKREESPQPESAIAGTIAPEPIPEVVKDAPTVIQAEAEPKVEKQTISFGKAEEDDAEVSFAFRFKQAEVDMSIEVPVPVVAAPAPAAPPVIRHEPTRTPLARAPFRASAPLTNTPLQRSQSASITPRYSTPARVTAQPHATPRTGQPIRTPARTPSTGAIRNTSIPRSTTKEPSVAATPARFQTPARSQPTPAKAQPTSAVKAQPTPARAPQQTPLKTLPTPAKIQATPARQIVAAPTPARVAPAPAKQPQAPVAAPAAAPIDTLPQRDPSPAPFEAVVAEVPVPGVASVPDLVVAEPAPAAAAAAATAPASTEVPVVVAAPTIEEILHPAAPIEEKVIESAPAAEEIVAAAPAAVAEAKPRRRAASAAKTQVAATVASRRRAASDAVAASVASTSATVRTRKQPVKTPAIAAAVPFLPVPAPAPAPAAPIEPESKAKPKGTRATRAADKPREPVVTATRTVRKPLGKLAENATPTVTEKPAGTKKTTTTTAITSAPAKPTTKTEKENATVVPPTPIAKRLRSKKPAEDKPTAGPRSRSTRGA